MDNIGRALQMAASAFLFIIAATIAIFLYTLVIENTKSIIVISDNNNSASEYAIISDDSYVRAIKKEEIIFTILDLLDEDSKTYIDTIKIGTFEFSTEDTEEEIRDKLNDLSLGNNEYKSQYDAENKVLKYELK